MVAWQDGMNAHDGINGHPVKVVIKDDGGNAFFFNATATTEIYTLSLHDALPIWPPPYAPPPELDPPELDPPELVAPGLDPPEPELLLPHPAASAPTAASAMSATSGWCLDPNLLGRTGDSGRSEEPRRGPADCPAGSPGFTTARLRCRPLMPNQTLTYVPPSPGGRPRPHVSTMSWRLSRRVDLHSDDPAPAGSCHHGEPPEVVQPESSSTH